MTAGAVLVELFSAATFADKAAIELHDLLSTTLLVKQTANYPIQHLSARKEQSFEQEKVAWRMRG